MTRNWRKQPSGCWWSFSPGFKTKTKTLAWILEIETDKKKKHIQISGPFKILVTSPRKKFIQIFWQKSAKKWIKFFWKMSWNRLTGERLFSDRGEMKNWILAGNLKLELGISECLTRKVILTFESTSRVEQLERPNRNFKVLYLFSRRVEEFRSYKNDCGPLKEVLMGFASFSTPCPTSTP